MVRALWLYVLAIIIMYAIADDGDDLENLESIFLRHYTGKTLDEYIDYPLNDVSSLQTRLNPNRKTVLYIHGYKENLQKNTVRMVVQAYLIRSDHNIIALSYAELVNGTYRNAIKNIDPIAKAVASVLNNMSETGFNTENLHIVSISLGAHVAGRIGRNVVNASIGNFTVPRITGLDPAGPNFNDYPELCLSSSDARFVDIIHTDQGYYGINLNRGTVDFFPNGGYRLQPGCQRALYIYPYDICSHKRCCEIYAESVNNELAFLGVECSSWDNFLSGECNNNTQVIMGYGTPNTA
ncbi:phospholipase A1 member A-like [Harpegnathos saltator]|uniref:phospholipase A1 member A-like n=1 Tax=Harpegnathos saltator TaxID=610380 RepID=UPI000DBED1D9|nr:phospholipase A1 member A-like [Harpegnathos saltator]